MRAFLIIVGLVAGSVLTGEIYDRHVRNREAEYVRELTEIMERNARKAASYVVLAQEFVWSDALLASCGSSLVFDGIAARERDGVKQRLTILNGIEGSVQIGAGYEWRSLESKKLFMNAYRGNQELLKTVQPLRVSANGMLTCLESDKPVG